MSIEIGKWYKSTDSKSLYYVGGDFFRIVDSYLSYGFNQLGEWSEYRSRTLDGFIEATKEEVEERLTEEAIKRGLKVGATIKSLGEDYTSTIEEYEEYYLDGCPDKGIMWNEFCLGGCFIMKDGIWAEPILVNQEIVNLSPVKSVESLMTEECEGYGLEPTETFYYLKSSHGDNFYKILERVQVKNEYHDWREYVKYMQLGTEKIFHKPTDMFFKEFKRVEV